MNVKKVLQLYREEKDPDHPLINKMLIIFAVETCGHLLSLRFEIPANFLNDPRMCSKEGVLRTNFTSEDPTERDNQIVESVENVRSFFLLYQGIEGDAPLSDLDDCEWDSDRLDIYNKQSDYFRDLVDKYNYREQTTGYYVLVGVKVL